MQRLSLFPLPPSSRTFLDTKTPPVSLFVDSSFDPSDRRTSELPPRPGSLFPLSFWLTPWFPLPLNSGPGGRLMRYPGCRGAFPPFSSPPPAHAWYPLPPNYFFIPEYALTRAGSSHFRLTLKALDLKRALLGFPSTRYFLLIRRFCFGGTLEALSSLY